MISLLAMTLAAVSVFQPAGAPGDATPPRPLVFNEIQRKFAAAPAMQIDRNQTYLATFETTKGRIVVELYAKDAPITVNNFVFLAKAGYFDGLNFHRYVPGFVVQGGDPDGNGTGGPGYTIKDEFGPLGRKHVQGAVGMARTQAPNSSGSQFYFCLDAAPHLDGGYTVFGQVTEGLDVVLNLRRGDVMTKVTIATPAPATQPSTQPAADAPTAPSGN